MRRLAAPWLALVCVLAVADSLQTPTPDLVGARAVAMGGAYVAAGADAMSHFHNPASLASLRDVRLAGQTNVTGRDDVEADPKGIAYGWRRWGLAWGNRIAEDPAGLADYTYLSAAAGVSSRVAVGVSGKFWRSHPSTRFQVLGGSATYDLGVLAALAEGWRVGTRLSQVIRGARPRAGAVGVQHDAGRMSAAVQLDYVDPGGMRVRTGGEWRVGRGFAVRAGSRGTSPTLGAGWAASRAQLDIAWTTFADTSIVVVSMEAPLGR
ncbi:MAG: hypothetical protein ABGY41_11145 [Candidatus Poribacteria bacterium]